MTPIRNMSVVPTWKTYLPHILTIMLLWSIAMTMDYHDEMQAAQASAQSMSQQMAQCLNGEWQGTSADGTQIKCWPAETYNQRRGS